MLDGLLLAILEELTPEQKANIEAKIVASISADVSVETGAAKVIAKTNAIVAMRRGKTQSEFMAQSPRFAEIFDSVYEKFPAKSTRGNKALSLSAAGAIRVKDWADFTLGYGIAILQWNELVAQGRAQYVPALNTWIRDGKWRPLAESARSQPADVPQGRVRTPVQGPQGEGWASGSSAPKTHVTEENVGTDVITGDAMADILMSAADVSGSGRGGYRG